MNTKTNVWVVVTENLFDRSAADEQVSSTQAFWNEADANNYAEEQANEAGLVLGLGGVWWDEDEGAVTVSVQKLEVA